MKKIKLPEKRHKGFTLLEMMVVLSVIAILLSWGLPSLQQSIRNNQVLAQSNELVAILHLAKSEALRRNTNVSIDFDVSDDGWEAIIEDPAEVADIDGCLPGQLRCIGNTATSLEVMDGNGVGLDALIYNNRGYLFLDLEEADDDDFIGRPAVLFVQHELCAGNNQRRRIDVRPTGQIGSCALPCGSEAVCP